MASTIYIIYNARASLAGKLTYAYHKVTSATPPCAACDLTHGGGLRLTETPQWSATKKLIGADVLQLHTDELPPEVVDFASANAVKYPAVLGKAAAAGGSGCGGGGGGEGGGGSGLQVLLTREDLAGLKGDHALFLKLLAERAAEGGVTLGGTSGAATAGVGVGVKG